MRSYIPQTDDDRLDEAKAWYLGKGYWKQFLRRHGHRLIQRSTGRTGPQSPMMKVEDHLVDMMNGLGRPVRPSEGVRMAIALITGTDLEAEMRSFKVSSPGKWALVLLRTLPSCTYFTTCHLRALPPPSIMQLKTLKQKSAVNNRGELLGPGYWRAFLRRNGHMLIHMEEEKKDRGDADAISGTATEPLLPVVPPPAVVAAVPPPNVAHMHAHNIDAANAAVAHAQLGVGMGMRETIVDAAVAAPDMSRVNMGQFALGENWYSGMHTNSTI